MPEMGLIQNDTAPLRARDIVLLARTRPSPPRRTASTIADRIATWDGACTLDSLGCAAYMAWEYRVLRDIFDDELGTAGPRLRRQPVELGRPRQLLDEPDSPWWDDTTTPT